MSHKKPLATLLLFAAVGINLSGLLTGATLGNASYPLLNFENVRAGRSGQATI